MKLSDLAAVDSLAASRAALKDEQTSVASVDLSGLPKGFNDGAMCEVVRSAISAEVGRRVSALDVQFAALGVDVDIP